MAADVWATSMLDGQSPAQGHAWGSLRLRYRDEVPEPALAVVYTVTIEVRLARARHSGVLHGAGVNGGGSTIDMSATVEAPGATGGEVIFSLVSTEAGSQEIQDAVISFSFAAHPPEGADVIPSGPIFVLCGIDASAVLDGSVPDTGRVSAVLDARVHSIVAESVPVA